MEKSACFPADGTKASSAEKPRPLNGLSIVLSQVGGFHYEFYLYTNSQGDECKEGHLPHLAACSQCALTRLSHTQVADFLINLRHDDARNKMLNHLGTHTPGNNLDTDACQACNSCGFMTYSTECLEKHAVEEHPGQQPGSVSKIVAKKVSAIIRLFDSLTYLSLLHNSNAFLPWAELIQGTMSAGSALSTTYNHGGCGSDRQGENSDGNGKSIDELNNVSQGIVKGENETTVNSFLPSFYSSSFDVSEGTTFGTGNAGDFIEDSDIDGVTSVKRDARSAQVENTSSIEELNRLVYGSNVNRLETRLVTPSMTSNQGQSMEPPAKDMQRQHASAGTKAGYCLRRKAFACPKCCRRFPGRADFHQHMRDHRQREMFRCHLCRMAFTLRHDLELHIEAHCKHKDDCSANRNNVGVKTRNDKNNQINIGQHTLMRASNLFGNKDSPATLINLKQKAVDLPTIKNCYDEHSRQNRAEKKFKCSECGKAFASGRSLNIHMRRHTDKESHICQICGKTFARKYDLNIHGKSHKDQYVSNKGVQEHFSRAGKAEHFSHTHTGVGEHSSEMEVTSHSSQCPVCSKQFTTMASLQDHISHQNQDEVVKPIQCPLCRKNFTELSGYARHVTRIHKAKTFECRECGRGFALRQSLKIHARTHTGKGLHKCQVCNKGYPRKCDLVIHMRSHTGEQPFKCQICDKGYALEKSLRKHLASSHPRDGDGPLKYSLYGVSYADEASYKLHMRQDHKKVVFQCKECGQSCASQESLNSHLRSHTGNDALLLTCPVCQKCFTHSSDLELHTRSLHSDAKHPLICRVCGKRYMLMKNLKRHVSSQHPQGNHMYLNENDMSHTHVHQSDQDGTSPPDLECKVCGKRFALKISLDSHARIHMGDRKPTECHICRKTFKKHCILVQHMRSHTGERPFNCEVCGKFFSSNRKLTIHRRRHTGENVIVCQVCGVSLTHKYDFERHMQTHSGEKPFSCETCGLAFSTKGACKRHQTLHTGSRPFQCEECGKDFNRAGTLESHMRRHRGDKRHKCGVCGMAFIDLHHMKTHQRRHGGVKSFRCGICGKGFVERRSLARHEKRHEQEGSRIFIRPPSSPSIHT